MKAMGNGGENMSVQTVRATNNTDVARTPIVFFDGVCELCNRSVDLLLRADTQRVFAFASLQGETARELLPPLTGDTSRWSIVYLDERGEHRESDAVLAICRRLGGPWRLLGLARVLPRWLRDPAYRFIARHRYGTFGERATCRIPTAAERSRFLP
ncbi:MAG: hypothetical protein QOF51_337 [Chloroflexota bacterium]|nr:hypothetical protein [Chloroflexota bacterium]